MNKRKMSSNAKSVGAVFLAVLLMAMALAGCSSSSGSAGSTADKGSSAAAAAPADTAGTEDAGGDTIIVGGLWQTTGFMADYEIPGSEGFELALEEINAAGGIDGKQIEYVYYNGESELDLNSSLIAKLIDVDGAKVVVGLGDPNSAIASGTVAQGKGVPTLATSSTLPYTQDRVGDTAFLVPFGDNVQAYAAAEYAYSDLGLTSVYVVTDSTDEYTLSLSKFFQERFTAIGGTVLGENTYDDNGYTDFSPSIQKIKALDTPPEALFFASFTDQGPTILKQFRDAGLDQPVFSGDGLDSVAIAEIAGEAANNTYFTTHVDYTESNAKVANFLAAYTAKYGEEPLNAFAALGYDAAYLIKYAIEKNGNGDYSAEGIKNALGKVTDFEGITGTISYANGHVPNKTVYICEFKDGTKVNLLSVLPAAE
ncbi:amino acid ABC transporter substrate-binding protein [Clostridia bacterium]|nr:amino acid ABC transporter substrate-binding protein [Clostridia bacterium]